MKRSMFGDRNNPSRWITTCLNPGSKLRAVTVEGTPIPDGRVNVVGRTDGSTLYRTLLGACGGRCQQFVQSLVR